jgi:hypothetical protein
LDAETENKFEPQIKEKGAKLEVAESVRKHTSPSPKEATHRELVEMEKTSDRQ